VVDLVLRHFDEVAEGEVEVDQQILMLIDEESVGFGCFVYEGLGVC
jgi:hypothetical protein